jgi:hypothetical protein
MRMVAAVVSDSIRTKIGKPKKKSSVEQSAEKKKDP